MDISPYITIDVLRADVCGNMVNKLVIFLNWISFNWKCRNMKKYTCIHYISTTRSKTKSLFAPYTQKLMIVVELMERGAHLIENVCENKFSNQCHSHLGHVSSQGEIFQYDGHYT